MNTAFTAHTFLNIAGNSSRNTKSKIACDHQDFTLPGVYKNIKRQWCFYFDSKQWFIWCIIPNKMEFWSTGNLAMDNYQSRCFIKFLEALFDLAIWPFNREDILLIEAIGLHHRTFALSSSKWYFLYIQLLCWQFLMISLFVFRSKWQLN